MASNQATCPVCQRLSSAPAVYRNRVPVHQNILISTPDEARNIGRGELSLHVCEACGFGWNAAFDPGLLSYGEAYDNTQSCSPCFDAYTDTLVQEILGDPSLRDARFVEVGCGKGAFLRKVVAGAGARAIGWGFDPSYLGPDEELGGRLRFVRTFYDERSAKIGADALFCRHVIEHVADPLALLASVRGALASSPGARVFFETPCLRWILEHQVVWDLFYEHCSLFTGESLAAAFRSTGFRVEQVRHVFGGQYLWLEATLGEEAPSHSAGDLPRLASQFALQEAQLVDKWRVLTQSLREGGGVCVWGAGAKGVSFVNLVDPERVLIDCVVDINRAKQGKYIPGTGHAIVSPSMLEDSSVRTALILNPNYHEEIRRSAGVLAPALQLVNLMQQE